MIKDHALTACRRERLTVRNLASRRGKTRVESVNTPAAGSAGLRGGDRVHGERPCLLWLTVRFANPKDERRRAQHCGRCGACHEPPGPRIVMASVQPPKEEDLRV
jgi:hypothetical protein